MIATAALFTLGALVGAAAVPHRIRQPPDANPGGSMSRIRSMSRTRKVLSGLALLALVPTVSYAAWTLFSTGDGDVQVGSLQSITIAPSLSPTATLLPSDTASSGELSLKVTNPNPAMTLTGVALDSGGSIVSGNTLDCASNLFRFTPKSGLSIAIPNGTTVVRIPGAVGLSGSAPQTCSGVTASVKGVKATFST